MAEGLRVPLQDVIGDAAFAEAMQRQSAAPADRMASEVPTIEIDAHGNIAGDTSSIDPHILAQLQSPQTKAEIAAIYRRSRYGAPEPPRGHYITESADAVIDQLMGRPVVGIQRRDLSGRQLAPGRIGRRLQRQYMRKRTKIERASAKENHHGRQSDEPAAGDSTAGV